MWQSCAPKWRCSGDAFTPLLNTEVFDTVCISFFRSSFCLTEYLRQGRDAVQGGGGETRDGVSAGLAEEAHGAERVAAEERGGGAQGDLSILLMYLTPRLLR